MPTTTKDSFNRCSKKISATKQSHPNETTRPICTCPVVHTRKEKCNHLESHKHRSILLHHRLLPLWPVIVEGPTISQCRGILAGIRSQQTRIPFPDGANIDSAKIKHERSDCGLVRRQTIEKQAMERKYEEEKVIPTLKTLQDIIDELHRIFNEGSVDVDSVKALLGSYSSQSQDWKKYVNFDAFRYTRNLVDEGNGKFNLLILCWGEGQGTSIHDHSNADCFVKILAGQLKETIYYWPSASFTSTSSEPGQPMQEKDMHTYSADQVTYINDSMGVHRMENPSHSDPAISLHVYSPPFQSFNVFDIRTGQKRLFRVTF